MKKIFAFLFLIVLTSCSKSEDEIIIPNRTLNVTIGAENFELKSDLIASNENCNFLFVNAKYNGNNDLGFRIKFCLTKTGTLKNISLYNYIESNKEYGSADFNPISILSIKNFSYNPSTNYLHFEFEGDLVEVESSFTLIDVLKPRKFIKGQVTIKNIENTNCNSSSNNINFDTANLKFATINSLGTNDSSSSNPFVFSCFSENGYKISFKSAIDLWNLPIGQYNFNENDIQNRIDLEKYIGNIRATQLQWIRAIDWKVYQTSGNYIVQEHVLLNGQKITKGIFNINVYENSNLIHTINNAKFEILGF